MGIQDRDWYKEEQREKKAAADAEAARKRNPFKRRAKRIPVALLDNANPPKLWGSDWHWTIQLLVWLAIVALLTIIWRMTR